MKLLMEIVRARLRSIVVLVILLVMNTALACYALFWQAPRNEALQIRRNDQQRLLTSGGGNIAATYRQGSADLATFQTLVPPRKSFARVVGEILETARNNGLSVSAVTYKPDPVGSGGLIDYALSFSVTGKYAAIKSCFADIQRYKEMVVIDQFSLAGGRTTEEVVDMKLNLTVYLQAVTP